jgi:hypothetical protein
MANYLTVFNDHFIEFVTDVQSIFPEDIDLLAAKNALIAVRKVNPKLIVKSWIKYIVTPYLDKIQTGDINFFIEKDYTYDVTKSNNSDKILEAINRLREPIKNMNKENMEKIIKYIQNLSKLSLLVQQ